MASKLRILGGLTALIGAMFVPFGGLGIWLLVAGFLLVALARWVVPGPFYSPPPDPATAPMCPVCGHRMLFVEYIPDGAEYRCAEHGLYALDSEGLFSGATLKP